MQVQPSYWCHSSKGACELQFLQHSHFLICMVNRNSFVTFSWSHILNLLLFSLKCLHIFLDEPKCFFLQSSSNLKAKLGTIMISKLYISFIMSSQHLLEASLLLNNQHKYQFYFLCLLDSGGKRVIGPDTKN